MSTITYSRPAWMDLGLCAQVDPNLFFAEFKGDKHARTAVKVCATCDVKDQCFEYAMNVQPVDDFGVWGGTTEMERKRLRLARKGIHVIDLTDDEIEMAFDLRDYLDEEPVAKIIDLNEHDEFSIDEAAEEAALEAEIERELRVA